MEPMTRQCPHLGRYDVVYVTMPPTRDTNGAEHSRLNYGENIAEVRATKMMTTLATPRCLQTGVDGLNIGCTRPDLMEFDTDCHDKAQYSK